MKGKIISRYATYKIWGDRPAPHNIEFNGRLIGQLTSYNDHDICGSGLTIVSVDVDNKQYCSECGYQFRYKKDAQAFNYCPKCGRKIVKG
nr:MAG TPA: putative cytoplasmic protein [Caudoviricetes sp.]